MPNAPAHTKQAQQGQSNLTKVADAENNFTTPIEKTEQNSNMDLQKTNNKDSSHSARHDKKNKNSTYSTIDKDFAKEYIKSIQPATMPEYLNKDDFLNKEFTQSFNKENF